MFGFNDPGFIVVGFRDQNETLYRYENLNIPSVKLRQTRPHPDLYDGRDLFAPLLPLSSSPGPQQGETNLAVLVEVWIEPHLPSTCRPEFHLRRKIIKPKNRRGGGFTLGGRLGYPGCLMGRKMSNS